MAAKKSSVPTSLRERLKITTNQVLLKAVEEVIIEHGIDKTTMNMVAQKGGVSVGTLYKHFQDKFDLLSTLFQSRSEELMNEIKAESIKNANKEFLEHLQLFCLHLFKCFEARKVNFKIILESDEERLRMLFRIKKMHDPGSVIVQELKKIIQKGLKEEKLAHAGSELYPTLLLGMFRSVFLMRYNTNESTAASDVQFIINLFMHGAGK